MTLPSWVQSSIGKKLQTIESGFLGKLSTNMSGEIDFAGAGAQARSNAAYAPVMVVVSSSRTFRCAFVGSLLFESS